MEVNEAMLIVAEEVAHELGYIEVSKEVINGLQDNFGAIELRRQNVTPN